MEVRKVSASERVEKDRTSGMIREEAFSSERVWAGLVRTAPLMTSGWHHHGDHETAIFVESGACRFEFGAGGRSVLDAQAGDFIQIPPQAIHRESNPMEHESRLVVVRAGSGAPTVNVEGPEGEA